MKDYWVYIAASRSKTLYVGVTNDLRRRMYEHKAGEIPGFSAQYRINRLVYYEQTSDVNVAIEREKEIKGWRRERKIRLVESRNPGWADLSDGWGVTA